ncbi:MAG: hypothetical protein CSA64_01950 [Arachnia propionica]|nr:MAG: hypothetical protein CSA64_01950 [Arachnia propionica]
MEPLIVDCANCQARPKDCQDCVVTVLLGEPSPTLFDATEQRAIAVLADCGLVPPMRMKRSTHATVA